MRKQTRRRWLYSAAPAALPASLIALAIFVTGCGRETPAPSQAVASAGSSAGGSQKKSDHASVGHSHVAPHGGQVQAVGDNHFELTYDAQPARFTLYVLGTEENRSEPIPDKELTLQVRDEASGQFKSITLPADPQAGEPAGNSSRFAATSAELAELGNFTAVARVPIAGQSYRVAFQFVDGKPISAGLAAVEAFACPMLCEKDKVYAKLGKCPVCGMKLEEVKGGKVAHADHNPKHGGVFFMAPDNWHHLEGTLASDHELRIYVYDNFTQPTKTDDISGELKAQPVNDQDEAVGQPVTVPIKPVQGKPYLIARLPENIKPPYQTEARLQFPKQKEKFLFNFDFKGIQHKD